MNNLVPAIRVEIMKARRSKMPLITALAFSLAPLTGGFFMIILKDPELALRLGLISTKAQLFGGNADWPTYLGMLAQATAIGGILLFSFVCSWVFGREYADHTIRNLLALPTPRYILVLAKFSLIGLWSVLLTVIIYLLGLGIGFAVGLPPLSTETLRQSTATLAVTAVLALALATPIAFMASAGHGYMPPMGAVILAIIAAQIIAVTGWGEFFPWSVPALYAGMAGPAYARLGAISYWIVIFTSLAGVIGTLVWWELADHTY